MRKLALGLTTLAGLAVAAVAGADKAEAQGFSVTIGAPGYYAPVGGPYGYGPPPHPHYRGWGPPPPAYGYGPPPGFYRGPRCWTRPVTVWNGWGYVTQHRRVCR